MIRRPPRSTRTDTLFPYTTLFRSKSIDEDRILRLFNAGIGATLRTNAFAPAAAEALAFKIDSSRIPGLPKPLPWREVFVYSPRVEGIHLRAGPVARGGLRWSDRSEERRVGKECVRTVRSWWAPVL